MRLPILWFACLFSIVGPAIGFAQVSGAACSPNGATAAPDANGNNLRCVSGVWVVAGGSGRVLLNTLTASNSANLSDTTSVTSSYRDYEIVFDDVIPATNNVSLGLYVHSSGSWQTSGYQNEIMAWSGTSTSSIGIEQGTNSPFLYVSDMNGSTGNTSPGLNGTIRIHNASSTSQQKTFIGHTASRQGSGTTTIVPAIINGVWPGTTAIDGLEFLESSGNIASGSISIYGLN